MMSMKRTLALIVISILHMITSGPAQAQVYPTVEDVIISAEVVCTVRDGKPSIVNSHSFSAWRDTNQLPFDAVQRLTGRTEYIPAKGATCTVVASYFNSLIASVCDAGVATIDQEGSQGSVFYTFQPAMVPTASGYVMQWNLLCARFINIPPSP